MKETTYKIQFERTFLLQDLPENLKRSDAHLQVIEDFIENTQICLRTIRMPLTKEKTWILEQKFPVNENDLSVWKVLNVYLDEAEYQVFEQLEKMGINEIRFNRYFYEYKNKQIEIDVFLGKELSGLILAGVLFESPEESQVFEIPEFAVRDVTQDQSFLRQNLNNKSS